MNLYNKNNSLIYDFVIVGAGSSGCVLASKLSENSSINVALIEAGPDFLPDQEPDEIRDPRGRAVYGSRFIWENLKVSRTRQEAEKEIESYTYLQGKIIGGSGSINAMLAMLPDPRDFDEWSSEGAIGWDASAMSKYSSKLFGSDLWSSTQKLDPGQIPLRLTPSNLWSPFVRKFAEIGAGRGFRKSECLSTEFGDAIGQIARNNDGQTRVSASRAFLTTETRGRRNLHIFANTNADKLIFEGLRAVGIRTEVNGRSQSVLGRKVIICAGAIHTPALLMRSGIGDGFDLQNLGIKVIRSNPSVGRNLHEHPTIGLAAHIEKPLRIDPDSGEVPTVALRYSSGIGVNGNSDMLMSIRSHYGWHAVGRCFGGLQVALYKPLSRGQVKIQSPDLTTEPKVELNLLSAPADHKRMLDGAKLAYSWCKSPEIEKQMNDFMLLGFPAKVGRLNKASRMNRLRTEVSAKFLDAHRIFRELLIGKVMNKGRNVDRLFESDSALSDWIMDAVYGSWHVAGTCKMGANDDPSSVVDSNCAVIGVENLYVVDVSIMPTPIRATTNLAAIMIAEKASHLLK